MNKNERIMIDSMAERLENGEAIRGHFNLLHSETQQELLAVAPNLLMNVTHSERLAMADALRGLIGAEVDA